MTVLLALDSSTDALTLALTGAGGQPLHVYEGEGGAKASETLLPQAQALLAAAGLALSDVDAIAFGRGPGAFTGLRTACAVAQGLAFGAGKPVLALDSLMLVAEDARLQAQSAGQDLPETIWVAMDARMGEAYAAAYAWQGERWQTRVEPALYSPEALFARWQHEAPQALCGSALDEFPLLASVAVPSWPQQQRRAEALAGLAVQAWAQGLQIDAAEALPLYVRDKVALTTQERLAARAVAS
jgi:tRNA threonylcarbamoyladenosine biosynthesis protein TsaB